MNNFLKLNLLFFTPIATALSDDMLEESLDAIRIFVI